MGNSKCVIFYSWQSDIRPVRNFIQSTLKSISGKELDLAIEIDHDTFGLPGSPKIEDAIIEKIKKCDLFVADVTIINQGSEARKVCNPNVLLELGVAIGTLGWEKIILLNCEDYGSINDLPFDFNHNRIVSFSIANGDKQKAKKSIIDRVIKTIEIHQDKGILHGGNPAIPEAKRKLHSELTRAFDNLLYGEIVMVSKGILEELSIIETALAEDDFEEFHQLFSILIKISEDDRYYKHQLKERCFEPIYLEYNDLLTPLDAVSVLNEHYYNLLNSLLPPEKQNPFSLERWHDNKIVFSSDPKHLIAYSKKGELLLDGYLNENGYFCGFQIENCGNELYVGNFEDGLRSGSGTLYVDYDHEDYRYPICSGTWENDELKDGTIYSITAYLYWITEMPEKGLPFHEFLIGHASMLHGCVPDVEDDLCPVFDVHIEQGIGKIIDGSMQRYSKEVFADKNLLLETYLNRIKQYNVPFNDISPLRGSIGINNEYRINKYEDFFGF